MESLSRDRADARVSLFHARLSRHDQPVRAEREGSRTPTAADRRAVARAPGIAVPWTREPVARAARARPPGSEVRGALSRRGVSHRAGDAGTRAAPGDGARDDRRSPRSAGGISPGAARGRGSNHRPVVDPGAALAPLVV